MQPDGNQKHDIFRLSFHFRNPVGQKVFSRLRHPLESIVALDRLETAYAAIAGEQDCVRFIEAAFRALDIRWEVSETDRSRIPRQGPAIVVANHPFGGVEGLVLIDLLKSIRPDVKVMANHILARIPQLRDVLILVDPFGRPQSAKANVRGLREAIRWVQGGGMLAVFPAGAVSHLQLRSLQITDSRWSETVAGIIRHTGASVLPAYFAGRNGPLFQLLGLVHPLLRTAMLPREFLNKRGRRLRVHVGDAVPASKLLEHTDEEIVAILRERTYLLGMRQPSPEPASAGSRTVARGKHPSDIEAPEPPSLLAGEVAALPPEAVLLESGAYQVCYASAAQIPHVLREIGRLREVTFRGAGEGSGKPLDLDRFDTYYRHLFIWNREAHEVVGAYRVARVDEVLREHDVTGLYTHTLFQFPKALFDHLGPTLELGRSFVRPEYQRSYAGLLLLWRGLGELVCRDPRYKVLFGPVSISNGYQLISRQLIVAYLRENRQMHPCASLVRPRHPFRRAGRGLPSSVLEDASSVDDISAIISHIEADQKGVPILLRNYLKLGASPLGFNVDPDFSDVLDVLVAVDLTRTEQRLLERYMTPEGARRFLEYHGVTPAAAASRDSRQAAESERG